MQYHDDTHTRGAAATPDLSHCWSCGRTGSVCGALAVLTSPRGSYALCSGCLGTDGERCEIPLALASESLAVALALACAIANLRKRRQAAADVLAWLARPRREQAEPDRIAAQLAELNARDIDGAA